MFLALTWWWNISVGVDSAHGSVFDQAQVVVNSGGEVGIEEFLEAFEEECTTEIWIFSVLVSHTWHEVGHEFFPAFVLGVWRDHDWHDGTDGVEFVDHLELFWNHEVVDVSWDVVEEEVHDAVVAGGWGRHSVPWDMRKV